MRHLLTLFDLSGREIEEILDLAANLKREFERGERRPLLAGRTMAMLFEKPSLRTRVSFESAIAHLGGASQFLGDDVGWGKRESTRDFARVLSRLVDVIVCRAKSHARLEELAGYASCPVINALTDSCHPCQALADMLTLRELAGGLPGKKLAYVGDANNVARSLAVACGKLGVRLFLASPPEYRFDAAFRERLEKEVPGLDLVETSDAVAAVAGADAVYTDVWASMGQEAEQEQRRRDFAAFQVNAGLMAQAPAEAKVLHCLPARRGEEVTDEVLDSANCLVVEQAANRMHAQKGLLVWLLSGQEFDF